MIELDGFRLDTGPTVFTMPEFLADTFRVLYRQMSDYVQIDPVDPMYRAVFADGSELRVRHGREAMTDEIRRFADAREAGAFNEFCEWLTELYELEMPRFIEANFDSPLDLVKPWRALLDLVRHGAFGALDAKVASFFDDERLQRVFSFQAMYAGLAPREALALYSVITYMDTVAGRVRTARWDACRGLGLGRRRDRRRCIDAIRHRGHAHPAQRRRGGDRCRARR